MEAVIKTYWKKIRELNTKTITLIIIRIKRRVVI